MKADTRMEKKRE